MIKKWNIKIIIPSIIPLSSIMNSFVTDKILYVSSDIWILSTTPVDSILAVVLTVSPNIQYLGIFVPTTAPTTAIIVISI